LRIVESWKLKPKRNRIVPPFHPDTQKGVKFRCNKAMRIILPFLVKVGNFEEKSPRQIFMLIPYLTEAKMQRLLTQDEVNRLRAYLKKWGYKDNWLKDKD